MNDIAVAILRNKTAEWQAPTEEIVIGKDVLELLSTSMYVDVMAVYREYLQNSADAIDDARAMNLLSAEQRGRVDITIDPKRRCVRIRDNGIGIAAHEFAQRMTSFGASVKRGTDARGFRGVGRLAGIGFCRELIFRTRTEGQPDVSELRWDCRRLKGALRETAATDLATLVKDVVAIRRTPASDYPLRFFEVELNEVIRHRNDRLLNPEAVSDYLAQVAPIPFSPDFRFAAEILERLSPQVALGNLEICVNGAAEPLYRPHRNEIETEHGPVAASDVEIHEFTDMDGKVGAIGWILHHGYDGALPNSALVKGIRFRCGNMQVGDHSLVEALFPEARFNSWSIGEVHVLDRRITPNGRRDHFDHNVHLDNLFNQLGPVARNITRLCRQSSLVRAWSRSFRSHRDSAISSARAVARGGLAEDARAAHAESAVRSLRAMRRLLSHRNMSEDVRSGLLPALRITEDEVDALLAAYSASSDPLMSLPIPVRAAYQHMIALVYECTSNRQMASVLVEKILEKLRLAALTSHMEASPRSSARNNGGS